MSVIRGSRLGGWRPQALCSRRVPSAPGLSAQEWDPAGLAGHTHSHFDKCSEGFSAPGGHPPPHHTTSRKQKGQGVGMVLLGARRMQGAVLLQTASSHPPGDVSVAFCT